MIDINRVSEVSSLRTYRLLTAMRKSLASLRVETEAMQRKGQFKQASKNFEAISAYVYLIDRNEKRLWHGQKETGHIR